MIFKFLRVRVEPTSTFEPARRSSLHTSSWRRQTLIAWFAEVNIITALNALFEISF